jgi:phage gp37-like protein
MDTTTNPPAGRPTVLARYQCVEGTRELVGQRINGKVALSDIPTGEHGKVYLVERHIAGIHELDALVADYIAKAQQLGRPPMQGWF